MKEVWKWIEGFEGLYEVSTMGNVRSYKNNRHGVIEKPKMLKPIDSNIGYKQVNLCKDKKVFRKHIHRLVAETFIPNPQKLPVVNHLDETRDNNNVENLEWTTHRENVTYGTAIERMKKSLIAHLKSPDNPRRKDILCVETGVIYHGVRNAAKELGVSAGNISSCLKGKRPMASGFHWEYVKEK